PFDFLFVETVGVGKSEVEIAGLADTTNVVFFTQAGDEVKTMKAGLMEIADIFVINKSDHPDSEQFAKSLTMLAASKAHSRKNENEWQIPVIKTVATTGDGIEELFSQIEKHLASGTSNERQVFLLTEKVWRLIVKEKMKDVDRKKLQEEIQKALQDGNFNAFKFARNKY
ncbi:MAG: methylmalonyl Co-A mutase-associated GTPase MeaB, partial [Chitinophagales bacterium]